MFPSHYTEFWNQEHQRQRLQEAEQFRLAKLAAEQRRSLTEWKNWKPGLVTLLVKLGLLSALGRFLTL